MKGEMLLSNRKLTTEEKIAKSKLYAENMEKTQNRLKDMREAKRKLDAEIAEELEKAYIVNMQELGKHMAGKIGKGFSLAEYIEIVDCIFTLDEVTDYVNSEREKLKIAEKDKAVEIEPAEKVAHSEESDISA